MRKAIVFSLTIFFISFFPVHSFSQEYGSYQKRNKTELDSFIIPKMSVLVSPLSLIPLPVGSLQFGFDHHLSNWKNAMHYEYGYMLPFHPISSNQQYDLFGHRLRIAYRRFLKKPKKDFNLFLSIQYFFQRESWDLERWLEHESGQYEQLFEFDKKVTQNGILALFGGQRYGENKSRFIFDWQFGLGLKYRTVTNRGIPDDFLASPDDFFLFNHDKAENEGTTLHPTMQLSIKMGYIIK